MAENLSLDELMANAKDEGAELSPEVLEAIAGGISDEDWYALPTDIRSAASKISVQFIQAGANCDIDAVLAQLMK